MTGFANEIDSAVVLAPPAIADDAGIRLSVHHLNFVALDSQGIADWRARRAPLGMRPAMYREFCSTFFAAAHKDGLGPHDIDVRLKGSASVIYSGRHKRLPTELNEWRTEFGKTRLGRPAPTVAEELDIVDSFQRLYFHQPLPFRRPFDTMVCLKIDREKSDYDIQVSSDLIERRCMDSTIRHAFDDWSIHDPKYDFIYDLIASSVINEIYLWSHRWTVALGRSVNVKVFGATGPRNRTAQIGDLSSHFRAQDWMIRIPNPQED
ncbi:MAG: hypothetical protein ABJF01_20170 [bacterium]